MSGIIRKQNFFSSHGVMQAEADTASFPITHLPTEIFWKVIGLIDFKDALGLVLSSKTMAVLTLDSYLTLSSAKEKSQQRDLAQKISSLNNIRTIFLQRMIHRQLSLPLHHIDTARSKFLSLTQSRQAAILDYISAIPDNDKATMFHSASYLTIEERTALFMNGFSLWLHGRQVIQTIAVPSMQNQEPKAMAHTKDSYPVLLGEVKKIYMENESLYRSIDKIDAFLMSKLTRLDDNDLDAIATKVECRPYAHLIPLARFCKKPTEKSLFPRIGQDVSAAKFSSLCLANIQKELIDDIFSIAIKKKEYSAVRAMIFSAFPPSESALAEALVDAVELDRLELTNTLLQKPDIPLYIIEEALFAGVECEELGASSIEIILKLLSYRGDISAEARGKVIVKAAEFKQAELVKVILQSGVIPDAYRWMAAISAASVDDIQTIKLLQGKDLFNVIALDSAISKAIDYGCINATEYLLSLKEKTSPEDLERYVRFAVTKSWQSESGVLDLLLAKGAIRESFKMEMIKHVSEWSTSLRKRRRFLEQLKAAKSY